MPIDQNQSRIARLKAHSERSKKAWRVRRKMQEARRIEKWARIYDETAAVDDGPQSLRQAIFNTSSEPWR